MSDSFGLRPDTLESSSSVATSKEEAQGKPKTILLIERDENLGHFGQLFLETIGIVVLPARDYADAALISEHHSGRVDMVVVGTTNIAANEFDQIRVLYPELGNDSIASLAQVPLEPAATDGTSPLVGLDIPPEALGFVLKLREVVRGLTKR